MKDDVRKLKTMRINQYQYSIERKKDWYNSKLYTVDVHVLYIQCTCALKTNILLRKNPQITITLADPGVQINIQTYDIYTSNGGKRRPSLNAKIEHEESCSRDQAWHTRKASRISKAAVDNCGKGVGNFYLS